MVDLHSHSAASDGTFTPQEAALYASQKNLKAWALTDHDTVDGLFDAAKTCLSTGLNFIPGIEINVRWPSGEFHLLGMGLRTYSSELKDLISDLTESRRGRNQEIVNHMNQSGIENFTASQIGRPHFASYLMQIGKVKHRQEAFDRFLGKGRPWYAPHDGADLDVAVEAILSAGGVPVLAHPLSLYVSWGKMDETIEKIKNHGVQGLEAYHPAARMNEAIRLEEVAERFGMFVTAGSDYHGKGVRADRHLGLTSGGKKIDDRFYFEELLPALGDFDLLNTDWVKENPQPGVDSPAVSNTAGTAS